MLQCDSHSHWSLGWPCKGKKQLMQKLVSSDYVKPSPSCRSNYHCCYKTTRSQAHCRKSSADPPLFQRLGELCNKSPPAKPRPAETSPPKLQRPRQNAMLLAVFGGRQHRIAGSETSLFAGKATLQGMHHTYKIHEHYTSNESAAARAKHPGGCIASSTR